MDHVEEESKQGKARLLLVERHPLLRQMIRQLLRVEGSLEIVGEAEDGVQAVTEALRLQPELILIDLALPDINGLTLTRLLRELVPHTRVILLLDENHQEYRLAALEGGAAGFVVKRTAHEDLLAVLKGEAL